MGKNLVIFFYPKNEPQTIYRNLPMPFLKLSSHLVAHGYRVVLVDSRFENDYGRLIKYWSKEALCFCATAMTGYPIYHAIKASKILKQANPKIPVIWGGWHPSLLPEQTIKNEFIDIVIRGQGEAALLETLNALAGSLRLDGIKGITFKNDTGEITHNPARPFQDINDFTPVNFDLLDFNRYIHQTWLGQRTIVWVTSQGCSYNCAFCSTFQLYGRNWSSLSPQRILHDIEILVKRFSVDSVVFTEDNFFVDKERVTAICEGLLKDNLNLRWTADARIDRVVDFSDDFLALLQRSGCAKLLLGAESGDQEVLDLVDKKLRIEETYQAAKMLQQYGIIPEFFFMAGFPWNPKRDLEKTLAMIREIKIRYPDIQSSAYLFTPYPGTRLFDVCLEKGFVPPQNLRGWIKWSILSPTVPWVNKGYLDKLNRLTKFYLPFAYPSKSLRRVMGTGWLGLLYRMMHLIARFRIEHNFFLLPLEWHVINYFYYGIKLRFNIFRRVSVPR